MANRDTIPINSRPSWAMIGVMLAALGTVDARGQAPARFERPGKPREGLVWFGFADFAPDHVQNTLPILEEYGLKGTFCANIGRIGVGSPLWNKMCAMARAGHCFTDHTLEHRASDWGEPPNPTQWLRQTTESLRLFREAGIDVQCWWQPGGPGAKYTPALHDFLQNHYRWAFALQAAYPGRQRPMHWRFPGDRYNFVVAVGGGMDYAKDQADAQFRIEKFRTQAADAVAQGLMILYGGHHTPPGFKQWGLKEACRWMRQAGLRTTTLNEALHAASHTREYYGEFAEQMPNATLEADRDANGRPDGWLGCKLSPRGVGPADKPAMAIMGRAASTTLYGPEPGRNRLSLAARCAGDKPGSVTVDVQAVLVGQDFVDQPPVSLARHKATVGKDWQTISTDVEIAPQTDRLNIRISSASADTLVANPSFRRRSP